MATLLSSIETQARRRLIESAFLTTPGSITVTPQGTPGVVTWTYKLVAINATGTTEAGVASSTTTGAATLNGTDYNTLTWTAIPNASGYWVYRTVAGTSPATIGRIAVLGAVTTFDDQGAVGDNGVAPTVNTSGLTNPFWTSEELIEHINLGIKDLWRDITDLKQEHYLTIDAVNVTMDANTGTLTGVPLDVHKIYLIEPADTTINGTSRGLSFEPKDYNSRAFQSARSSQAMEATNGVIYYAIHGAGAPVGPPVVYVAPRITSSIALNFCYVPTLTTKTSSDTVPIPGEADNALIAWTVAFARSKEREDRSPDPGWIQIYASEKQHLLQSLGLRQYQENTYVGGMFEEYW